MTTPRITSDDIAKYCLNDVIATSSSKLNITTSGFSPLPSGIRPIITTSTGVDVGYWPDATSSDYYGDDIVYTINEAVKDGRLKIEKEEKEKKEMANAKVCDICGAVYSTKKYTKIVDDADDRYDIYLRFFDSCRNNVEICPDCYKALIDKLVERGLEPVEENDKKDG